MQWYLLVVCRYWRLLAFNNNINNKTSATAGRLHAPSPVSTAICGRTGAGVRCTLAVALAKTAATDHAIRKCAFSPNCWGMRGGWGVGWKWAPIGGLQYQTHMQAPKYGVQFLRSEALRSSSSSSSSSRMRQIKECYISNRNGPNLQFFTFSCWRPGENSLCLKWNMISSGN